MQITRVLNDTRATRVTDASKHSMNEMSDKVLASHFDAKGLVFAFGRGETDPTVTYLELTRNGESGYIILNEGLDGIVVQAVKP